VGTGYNTLSLVDHVIDFKDKNNIVTEEGFDELWVVFDKDDFDKDFDNAINKAAASGLRVAYSNECFELWYLLHFIYIESALTREEIVEKLTTNLKKHTGDATLKYQKHSESMYSLIRGLEKKATDRAESLLKIYSGEKSFKKKNPSTTVHTLVSALKKLSEEI
jgi:hypothetical protein